MMCSNLSRPESPKYRVPDTSMTFIDWVSFVLFVPFLLAGLLIVLIVGLLGFSILAIKHHAAKIKQ